MNQNSLIAKIPMIEIGPFFSLLRRFLTSSQIRYGSQATNNRLILCLLCSSLANSGAGRDVREMKCLF